MINNEKYELLEGWLFWYEADDELWKAAIREDFIKNIRDRSSMVQVISATSFADLIRYLTVDFDDVN